MKKITAFVYLLLTTYIVSAQSPLTYYTGTIKGYNSNMGFKTGQVIVNNVITGVRANYLITIQSDGSFSASFPLTYIQECWIALPFSHSTVYFEPGKKIIQDFDISDSRQVSSAFKGDCATINNALNHLRPISMAVNWDAIDNDIYPLGLAEYKAYFLQRGARKLAAIDSVARLKGLHAKAIKLAKLQVTYDMMGNLINYQFIKESAYRRKKNISFEDKKPVLEEIKADTGYFDFLQTVSYNDPGNMVSYAYYEFIMRLMSITPIKEEAKQASLTTIDNAIAQASKDAPSESINALRQLRENILRNDVTLTGTLEKARPVILKRIIRKDISLELDVIYLQSIGHQLDMQKDTLSAVALQKLKSDIKNKILLTDIVALNDNIKQHLRATSYSDSPQYHQIPADMLADSIYTAIFDKYKGKVVFVDFWATWCGPCMEGMKTMEALKDELAADSNIVFVNITNHSSPEKAYQTAIPGIKGEHYRISGDQYNFFTNLFQINGIPHYVMLNKKGVPTRKNFRWREPDDIKKALRLLESE